MARREKLTEEQKIFVVQRLAIGDTPDEAARAVNLEFGVEISRQACEKYDPTKAAGKSLSKPLRDRFFKTRERFYERVDGVPDAEKAIRVKRLSAMSRTMEKQGNFIGAAAMLEQIAKEMGRVYTNRTELTGKDGKDFPAASAVVILPAKETTERAVSRVPGRKAKR